MNFTQFLLFTHPDQNPLSSRYPNSKYNSISKTLISADFSLNQSLKQQKHQNKIPQTYRQITKHIPKKKGFRNQNLRDVYLKRRTIELIYPQKQYNLIETNKKFPGYMIVPKQNKNSNQSIEMQRSIILDLKNKNKNGLSSTKYRSQTLSAKKRVPIIRIGTKTLSSIQPIEKNQQQFIGSSLTKPLRLQTRNSSKNQADYPSKMIQHHRIGTHTGLQLVPKNDITMEQTMNNNGSDKLYLIESIHSNPKNVWKKKRSQIFASVILKSQQSLLFQQKSSIKQDNTKRNSTSQIRPW